MVSERRRAMWAAKNRARRQKVLDAALALAEEKGYRDFTGFEVAQRAGLSKASVIMSFRGMNGLRREVMSAAITRKVLPVIAQGLVAGDPTAAAAPYDLKKQASEALL